MSQVIVAPVAVAQQSLSAVVQAISVMESTEDAIAHQEHSHI